jgi:hypothetical protein
MSKMCINCVSVERLGCGAFRCKITGDRVPSYKDGCENWVSQIETILARKQSYFVSQSEAA